MDTSPINWKCASKNHSLVVLALVILQHLLNTPEINAEATQNVHIVYLGVKKYDDPESTKKSHHKMLSTLLGSKEAAQRSILYSYRHGFSGFAARLTQSEAESIAEFPEVVQVIPNRIHKLHTTRSWDFIGIHPQSPKNGSLPDNNMGKGTIIGVIDSGVWPESESFNDEGMDPIPPRWKGICQEGEQFNSTNCNKKLIGARWFVKGALGQEETKRKRRSGSRESLQEDYMSARDGIGHGTHTASTAGGYYVKNANYGGLAEGVARGGAPLAHLAIYKACWGTISSNGNSSSSGAGCSDADLLKAFDKAIHDGVDILSVSIGNEIPLYSYVDQRDSIAIASFHAIENGITVVCSDGNDGPISQTISNTAPWLITVAATTIDRTFLTPITLGNNQTFWGQSINHIGKHKRQFSSLTYSERIALHPSDDSAGLHIAIESGELKEKELPDLGKEELRCLKRADLIQSLADDLPADTIRFKCQVISAKLDPITSFPILKLLDGTLLKPQVVIGCDGVNSVISASILRLKITKHFSTCVIRGFTNYEDGHEFGNEFVVMSGKDQVQLGRMPITDKLVYWFLTRKWSSLDNMISKYPELIKRSVTETMTERHFPKEAVEMISKSELDSLHVTEQLRYRPPLELLRRRFRIGTVTVAGDAMHAMGPFLAQGGSASLEDAVVLGRCLARNLCTTSTSSFRGREMRALMVRNAFDEYVKERRMRVFRLSMETYLIGMMLDSSSVVVKFIGIVLMCIVFRDPNGHTRYNCGRL